MKEYLRHWQFWVAVLVVVAVGNFAYDRLVKTRG